MRFSNFIFTESRDPSRDSAVIDEVVDEVRLSEELGLDAVWLSEHHFDGNCAYVDPISFAAALAVATKRIRIGLAVAQMSLHHPIRLAEQLSLIDNLSKGRLIVGLGRGDQLQHLRIPGLRHRPGGIPGAVRRGNRHPAEGLDQRGWLRPSWQVLGCERSRAEAPPPSPGRIRSRSVRPPARLRWSNWVTRANPS